MRRRVHSCLGILIVVLFLCIGCLTALAKESSVKAAESEPFAALAAELAHYQGNFGSTEKAVSFLRSWFRKRNIEVEIVSRTSKTGNLNVVVVGIKKGGMLGLPTFPHQAVIWWGSDGKVKLDQLKVSGDPVPMPEQVVLGRQEMGLVYDEGYGSAGTVRPSFTLYRFDGARCRLVWHSPNCFPWRDQDAELSFPDGTPDKIVIEGAGWLSSCVLDNIIEEPHVGPHRLLRYTWERRGDTYVITEWDEAKDTPYNALLNFMYGLITGDKNYALRYAESKDVLAQADACGFKPTPETVGGERAASAGWTLKGSEPDDCWYRPDPSVPYSITLAKTNIFRWSYKRVFGGSEEPEESWMITVAYTDGHWKVRSVSRL